MYMITIVQTHAYKVTGDSKYIDRAAREMTMYLDELQRPNGLFYHAPDVPFYWGRGNGWMAAGMTELLRYLPKNHKDRPRILEGYDDDEEPEGVPESRRSMEPAFGRPCLLDGDIGLGYVYLCLHHRCEERLAECQRVCARCPQSLAGAGELSDREESVREICVGTNKKNDKQYYYDRPRRTGDFHAQGPYLWCVAALME